MTLCDKRFFLKIIQADIRVQSDRVINEQRERSGSPFHRYKYLLINSPSLLPVRSLPLFSSRNARLSHVFPRNSITRSIFESNRIESNFPSLSIRRYKHKCLILRELKRGDDPSFSIFAYANSLRVHSYVYESACVQAHVHTRARACTYIVLFMENRATESDRQSRQGACAAFRG